MCGQSFKKQFYYMNVQKITINNIKFTIYSKIHNVSSPNFWGTSTGFVKINNLVMLKIYHLKIMKIV